MSFAILENRFAILRNIKDRFAICDLRSVNSDPVVICYITFNKHLEVVFIYYLGVAPFPGATTGTGGRIRDVQATGTGSNVVAGTAGYCFGNLNLPGTVNHRISYQPSYVYIRG